MEFPDKFIQSLLPFSPIKTAFELGYNAFSRFASAKWACS
jgi:hypothetical protein